LVSNKTIQLIHKALIEYPYKTTVENEERLDGGLIPNILIRFGYIDPRTHRSIITKLLFFDIIGEPVETEYGIYYKVRPLKDSYNVYDYMQKAVKAYEELKKLEKEKPKPEPREEPTAIDQNMRLLNYV